jgi:hypothetical protein
MNLSLKSEGGEVDITRGLELRAGALNKLPAASVPRSLR